MMCMNTDKKKQLEKQLSKQEALKLVEKALNTIGYGEVVVKIQGGKPIFVERREQERIG